MKSLFLQILHWIWFRRENIYSIYKKWKDDPNIKFDWKVSINELIARWDVIKNSGLLISPEDLEPIVASEFSGEVEEKYGYTPKPIPEKDPIEYHQIWPTCAIYSMGRSFMYNSWLTFTQDEHEEVAQLARDKWWLGSWGMTFINAGRAWKIWLEEKGIEAKVIRVPVWGEIYNELKDFGHSCQIGGYITREMMIDREEDWDVDIEKYKWNEQKRYGHAWDEQKIGLHTDNWVNSLKYNRYTNNYFSTFIKKGYGFSWAYFPVLMSPKEPSDYEKYLERGIIEQPNPSRVMTEELYGTFRERELQKGL